MELCHLGEIKAKIAPIMEGESGLIFHVYQPQTEELQELDIYDPISVYPADALNMVDEIIQKSIDEAPDLEKTNIQLAPRKNDTDIKRIMKPQIDELINETKEALLKMKKEMKKEIA